MNRRKLQFEVTTSGARLEALAPAAPTCSDQAKAEQE